MFGSDSPARFADDSYNLASPMRRALAPDSFRFLRCDVFHLERSAADMQIALGIWDLDAGSGEMLVDQAKFKSLR